MSVIFYSPKELGEVAACASVVSPQPVGGDVIGMLSRRLAEYSKANVNAYNHTYRESEKGHSAAEIESAARAYLNSIKNAPPPKGACSRAERGLAYNAVANDGTDFASRELAGMLKTLKMQTERAAKMYADKDEALEASERAAVVAKAKSGRATAKAVEGLKPYTPPPATTRTAHYRTGPTEEESYDKRTAVNRIKKALKARTGRTFEVKTSNTWQDSIDIRVPKDRRECYFDGRRSVPRRELEEYYAKEYRGKYDPEKADWLFENSCKDDRELLAKAMDLEPDYRGVLPGEYSCFGSGCTPYSVAVAEGREPTTGVRRYDYD
jgi:hypothetical protein